MKLPRLFISHGAGQDPDAAALIHRLHTELSPHFEVLVDRVCLEGGDEWSDELYDWMLDCHGAVLVLSSRALGRPWVIREATILEMRKRADPEFELIPVYLSGVTPDAVADPGRTDLAGLGLNRIQGETADDGLVERLRRRFERLEIRHGRTPNLIQHVAAVLTHGNDLVLRILTEALGIEILQWLWGPRLRNHRCLDIALRLTGMRLREVANGLEEVAGHYKLAQAQMIMECLAPFQVNAAAAEGIRETLRTATADVLLLNAESDVTGRFYAHRAFGKRLRRRFIVVPNCDMGCGSESLQQDIQREVRDFADAKSDDEAREELLELGTPVFVFVRGRPPDRRPEKEFTQLFPNLTFVFLTGPEADFPPADEERSRKVVRPVLEPGEERHMLRQYHRSVDRLETVWNEDRDRSPTGPSRRTEDEELPSMAHEPPPRTAEDELEIEPTERVEIPMPAWGGDLDVLDRAVSVSEPETPPLFDLDATRDLLASLGDRGVQVLLDRGHAMQSFRRDQDRLVDDLERLAGAGQVEVLHFDEMPERAGPGTPRTWTAYRPPTDGTPVLVVSDLGLLRLPESGGGDVEPWVAFARRVHDAGSRMIALVPCEPTRWPKEPHPSFEFVVWDRGGRP